MKRRRGRLLFPVKVEIAQLDTKATRDGGFYDDTARETKLASTADGLGADQKQEKSTVTLKCQLEARDFFERLNMFFQGDAPETVLRLTFHMTDLERAGILDDEATYGVRAGLKVGDRILGFKDRYGQQMFKVPDPPGLYVREVNPTGFLETQNLVVVTVGDRRRAAI